MKYETILLSERSLEDLLKRTNVLIEDDWEGDGEVRTNGSYYLQSMKRVTGCCKKDWE